MVSKTLVSTRPGGMLSVGQKKANERTWQLASEAGAAAAGTTLPDPTNRPQSDQK